MLQVMGERLRYVCFVSKHLGEKLTIESVTADAFVHEGEVWTFPETQMAETRADQLREVCVQNFIGH